MLSSVRTYLDDATQRECSVSFVLGASYPSNTTRAHPYLFVVYCLYFSQLYDASPFSEDTIEAGTNLNDHIKEIRKQKWEETITGITHNSTRKDGRPSQ